MKRGNLIIRNIGQIATSRGNTQRKGAEMGDLHVIENGMVIVSEGVISYVGQTIEDLPVANLDDYRIIDGTGQCLVPGFVDSHTHFVFGGYREDEFMWRLRGDSYMSIMERGGGIANTVEATRKASFNQLMESGRHRLDQMLSFGVTTVEGKSGYGLDRRTELKQLRVMKILDETHPTDIVRTFLGAHATPPEYKGREDEYIDWLIEKVMPAVASGRLAECCDVFCEKNVFTIEQSRRLLLAAREQGFQLKLHADEIVSFGGAELAAELCALSADHLLRASDAGIRDMAQAGVVATLLPCTAFSLREDYAQGRKMIDAGCAVALATDMNPGSCFTSSVSLAFALACIYMKMTPEEALTAFTLNGAAALGKADRIGSIEVGKQGDLLLLQYPSYRFLPYHVGMNIVDMVVKNGAIVWEYIARVKH